MTFSELFDAFEKVYGVHGQLSLASGSDHTLDHGFVYQVVDIYVVESNQLDSLSPALQLTLEHLCQLFCVASLAPLQHHGPTTRVD